MVSKSLIYAVIFYAAFAISLIIFSAQQVDATPLVVFVNTPLGAISLAIASVASVAFGVLIALRTDCPIVGYALATLGIMLALVAVCAIIATVGGLASNFLPFRV